MTRDRLTRRGEQHTRTRLPIVALTFGDTVESANTKQLWSRYAAWKGEMPGENYESNH